MNNEILKDLLVDPNTPATILNSLIIKVYSSRCYNWEPETLWLEILDDFNLKSLNDFTKNKINAVVALNTSDSFYNQWEVFENIGKAFNSQDVFFEDLTPLSPEELTWTVIEAKLNDDDNGTYSYDVLEYIKTCLKASGVATCPKFIIKDINYNAYVKFDESIETIYQKRIEAYCLMQLNKIISLSRKYFNVDMRKVLIKEIPILKDYIKT